MQAKKSYRIWFSQRNGSTLLCKGLEQTGVAGIPGEYFNAFGADSLCEQHNVSTWDELKDKLWYLGTSENGVFGIKHNMTAKIYREIATLKGMPEGEPIDEEELVQDLFPNCKHIFLTRRNKVRQAVSWWKAIKDNQWHLAPNQHHENEADFYEKNYDFDALSHLLKETALRECAIQAYYTKHDIQPLTLVYEDFIKDCWVWLYRGAWQEWPIDEIDMAVPLSPDELFKKRKAIFKHQSQKDSALFPGNDEREFWVRAEERNRSTAMKYDNLGLAEYEAIEAFKRHHF